MSRIWRIVAVVRQFCLPAVAFVLAGLTLSACEDFKKAVGIERTSPDEFAVESRAPLTIPPDFDLRPPAPGSPRPQEVSSTNKAQDIVDNVKPGEPGQQAPGALRYPAGKIDANSQVAEDGLSAKLLQTNDTGDSIVVEKRDTTTLQGIH
jgi:hypothetical protein